MAESAELKEALARHLFARYFDYSFEHSHQPKYWYGEAGKILEIVERYKRIKNA